MEGLPEIINTYPLADTEQISLAKAIISLSPNILSKVEKVMVQTKPTRAYLKYAEEYKHCLEYCLFLDNSPREESHRFDPDKWDLFHLRQWKATADNITIITVDDYRLEDARDQVAKLFEQPQYLAYKLLWTRTGQVISFGLDNDNANDEEA